MGRRWQVGPCGGGVKEPRQLLADHSCVAGLRLAGAVRLDVPGENAELVGVNQSAQDGDRRERYEKLRSHGCYRKGEYSVASRNSETTPFSFSVSDPPADS